jgi:hypothetical protein
VTRDRSLGECAVLFAIPTDRSQFDAQAQVSDYVRKLARGRDLDTAWRSDYENVAVAAKFLITTAHRVGARVYERATPVHLADATRSCRAVILFAHWRGAKIDASDLLAEPEILSQKLRQHPYFRDTYASDTHGIVDILNGAIEKMQLLDELPSAVVEAVKRSRSIGQTLCRDLIDEYLRGLLAPGNRLEFFSGLCTLDEVDRAVSAEFHGELDLALCHSEALATFLDLRHGDQMRHLYWPCLIHPVPQLLKVTTTLELLAAEGGSYIEKRLSLEEAETYS